MELLKHPRLKDEVCQEKNVVRQLSLAWNIHVNTLAILSKVSL